jgi:DNA-binding transcriptional MocR family regulator
MKKYEYVMSYIFRGIQTGSLKRGDYLPSIRELAKNIDLSSTTVIEAYARLESLGVIESHDRRGFCVVNTSRISHFHSTDTCKQMFSTLGAPQPQNDFFPSEAIGKYLAQTARANWREINQYGLTSKSIPENYSGRITAAYMFKMHSLTVDESEICHANGATEALFFALRAVTDPGDLVAVESPGFLGAYNHLKRMGLRPLEIEVNPSHGLELGSLERALRSGKRPKCIIVTPSFQNPTGALMPIGNRVRFMELCVSNGIAVIEDDVLGALRFGKRFPTLKELMPEEVIYVNSYSKTLAPGYRVGWVAGGKHTDNIRAIQGNEACMMTTATHRAVFLYLENESYKSCIVKLRQAYQENCDKMDSLI